MLRETPGRLAGQGGARGAGAGQDEHRLRPHDREPPPPEWQLQEIIRAHEPDKFLSRE